MFFALALTMSAPSVASASIRSDCVHDREAILALEFKAFDQTEGSGWRPLYHNGCYVEVAELLRRRGFERDGVIDQLVARAKFPAPASLPAVSEVNEGEDAEEEVRMPPTVRSTPPLTGTAPAGAGARL